MASHVSTLDSRRRVRRSFGQLAEVTPMPNLIDVQRSSYDTFLQMGISRADRGEHGLQETFNSIFPIEDFAGRAKLEFVSYDLETPKYDVEECQQRGLTYASSLKVTLRLEVWEEDEVTGARSIRDIKEQDVYMGDMPLMTSNGTFIVNGTVHNEGTIRGHQGHVAHIDVLLLDVADRTGTGDLVLFPHLEAQCHFQRRRISQAALLALFDIVFRRLEIVGDKFQLRPAGEILDREDRVEGLLKAVLSAIRSGNAHLQKCVVARALHIDQVRHGRNFRQLPKAAADTPATVESAYMRCHMSYLVKFPFDNRSLHNGLTDI